MQPTYQEMLETLRSQKEAAAAFPPVHIRLLRNYTIESLEDFLAYQLYSAELRPVVTLSGYNSLPQDILAGWEPVPAGEKEIVVLTLLLDQIDSDWNLPGWDSRGVQDYLENVLAAISEQTTAPVLIHTFLLPPDEESVPLKGELSLTEKIEGLNAFLKDYVAQHSAQFYLIDWNRLMRRTGWQAAIDERNWLMFASPLRPAFLAEYASEIAPFIKALTGRAKKCLILDCDNTLWGGVVGEEGLSGIQLDRNTYPGKAYYEFQKTILALAKRGVMLALCSKNNAADVWEVLDNHPYCLIKREHLAAWQINWEDKATNVKRLAEQLNIGLANCVFVDDNPVECSLVTELCPEVLTLQVPKKLAAYPALLQKDHLFTNFAVSQEDQNRAKLYQAEQARQAKKQRYQDLSEYLLSLQTTLTLGRATAEQAARIAQLTQKTNQFNLTTKRYAESEILGFINEPDRYFVLYGRVADCFGDLGLTGVLLVERDGNKAKILNFLLSCRVLGRQVETVLWQAAAQRIETDWLVTDWEAAYVPTAKNSQVADFWPKQGFSAKKDGIFSLTSHERTEQVIPHIMLQWEEEGGRP